MTRASFQRVMQQMMICGVFFMPRGLAGKAPPCQDPFVRAMLHVMSHDAVNAFCAALPGAECSDPWGGGHDAWKVGGKMFANIGALDTGVSVKTPDIETAQMLIDVGVGLKAPYMHRSWVFLPWGTDVDELEARLKASYDLIRGKLPKKVQATLG